MPKQSRSRARRAILAATLAPALAAPAVMLAGAVPAAARATAASAKKHRGVPVKVKSGTLTLTFTATAWSSLSGGSATVGTETIAVTPATVSTTGSFTFPISGGTLNSVTGKGTVRATGGFTISRHLSIAGLFESSSEDSASNPTAVVAATSTLELTSQNFTPPSNVPVIKLNMAHVKVIAGKHSVTISRIPASLTKLGLEFFGGSFKEGETVATVTVAAKG